jgi:uncharacterized protein YaeQ
MKAHMALPPTLHDFSVVLNDVDRQRHEALSVRVARHPSETLERVWLRLLAYCCLHEERLQFGPGLCEPDEPDLFVDDLTGRKALWVRVGRPDPAKLQREADRAGGARVAAVFGSPQHLEAFMEAAREARLTRLARVELLAVDPALLGALAAVDERRTRLELTIAGEHMYLQRAGRSLDGPLVRATLA